MRCQRCRHATRLLSLRLSFPLQHVEYKLTESGIVQNPRYKICLLVDYGAMVRVRIRRHGMTKEFNTKPLAVIWGKWRETSAENVSDASAATPWGTATAPALGDLQGASATHPSICHSSRSC